MPIIDKNPCNVVGFNVEKQDTNDFYMIKTFDDAGILRHIKTQLYDIQYTTYQFDYDITYAKNKTTFKGVTRQIDWMPSEIFDNGIPNFNPDAPFHPVENIYALERRNLEVVFDSKTGYAVEVRFVNDQQPLLTLAYDNKKFLKHVTAYGFDGISYDWQHEPTSVSLRNFKVETDKSGNILSILSDVDYETYDLFGVRYVYSSEKNNEGKNQFYETPSIFIHPMYSLLEILNWGPFQPNRERLGYGIQWAADPQDELFRPAFGAVYANHQYDNDGNLIGYDFDGAFNRSLGSVGGFPYQRKECMAMFGPGQVSFAKPIKTSVLMRNNTYLPDEVAVRFKHRIVSIHCFPNGNGRHSRLMADIIAEKIFKQPVFTWGAINFINTDNARAAYLSAIKIADKGDIGPLINFARS